MNYEKLFEESNKHYSKHRKQNTDRINFFLKKAGGILKKPERFIKC